MKQKIEHIFRHPLISGSAVIFFGALFGNVFNFIFSVYMISHLSSANNGTLIALISLINLPSLAVNSFAPTIINFAGPYFANDELTKVRGLYNQMGKLFFILNITLLIISLIFIPQISDFFHINDHFLLVLATVTVFIGLFNVLNSAFLQAKLAFKSMSALLIFSAVLKLGFGIVFVIVGYQVYGAVVALFLSTLIPFLLSFLPLKNILQKKAEKAPLQMKRLFRYSIPSAIAVLGMTAFITTDVLLVKHFFPPAQAGFYAGISLIGRVIFYFSSPIASVMFPLVVQKMSVNQQYTNIFFLSLLLVLVPSLAITGVYFFFPHVVLQIFHIKNISFYETNLLGFMGLYISLYAIVSILSNFYLSIKKTDIYIPITCAAVTQIILIWFYHATFFSLITISFTVLFLLFIVLLLYYPYATRQK